MKNTLIVIPCRMASTRLPGKPLLKFKGLPMVIRVAKIAVSANVGEVVIGCCDREVYDIAKKYKVNAIMTSKDHKSGSDRVFEVVEKIDPKSNISNVINLQGDMPTVSEKMLKKLLHFKNSYDCDLSTLTKGIIAKKESKRFLNQVQKIKKIKAGQLYKINIYVKSSSLKRNNKIGIF